MLGDLLQSDADTAGKPSGLDVFWKQNLHTDTMLKCSFRGQIMITSSQSCCTCLPTFSTILPLWAWISCSQCHTIDSIVCWLWGAQFTCRPWSGDALGLLHHWSTHDIKEVAPIFSRIMIIRRNAAVNNKRTNQFLGENQISSNPEKVVVTISKFSLNRQIALRWQTNNTGSEIKQIARPYQRKSTVKVVTQVS